MDPDVVRVYRDGVDAVVRVADRIDDEGWGRPACGHWTAADTARHLVSVAGWYHHWLDRAIAGDLTRPFHASEMAVQTAAALEEVGPVDGPDAVVAFVEAAGTYLERARAHWDIPFAYPYGLVTAGLHAGVAAAEWHVHAWDLSTVTDTRHRPRDAAGLLVAAGRCVATAEAGLRGWVTSRLLPLAARRSPWEATLARTGRT